MILIIPVVINPDMARLLAPYYTVSSLLLVPSLPRYDTAVVGFLKLSVNVIRPLLTTLLAMVKNAANNVYSV